MKFNVGGADRILRVLIGLVLIALGIFMAQGTTLKIILIAIGIILFGTGLSRFCLLYIPLKINTSKNDKS